MKLQGKRNSEQSMLESFKSKLGFSKTRTEEYDDEYYDEGYDEYGEYGENYETEYAEYGAEAEYDSGAPSSRYDSYAPVTTRSSSRRSSHASSGTSTPKLVSIDDVRAHTQIPESLSRDPLPPRRVTSASSSRPSSYGERTMIDSSLPSVMTPEGTAATAASASRRNRSEGLNSLFSSTRSTVGGQRDLGKGATDVDDISVQTPELASEGALSAGGSSSYDPYEAYAGSGTPSYSSARSLSVFKPASYGEVERIAKILKAGDAVVLCLRNTPDSLAKRILDFSFGVSSALDARVECIADKVFAITRSHALTDDERINLHNSGVL